jgi:general L-amino acid transport system permease protein
MEKVPDITQPAKVSFWNDPDKRAIVYQVVTLGIVGLICHYLFSNTLANLERQSIATGFGFLKKEASFEIGESLIRYSAADSYTRALLVGMLNTLLVSFIGVILTVFLGIIIGVARLSKNWLMAKLSALYIEVFQDIPLLLQLLFWYAIFYENLPSPRQALNPFAGLFLSNRGMVFAVPEAHPAFRYAFIAIIIACMLSFILKKWAKQRQDKTGEIFPVFSVSACMMLGFPLLAWWIGGSPTKMNIPKLSGFNFEGGVSLSPEFAALLLGLVLYTAAFVAEIVRAGIQSVSKGQTEAAMALGLKPVLILNLVILPQALRVIIPPLTSQMLNLIKNSTLAVAIGYPDFVYIANTTINQTGQAIEGVAMIMFVYLCFSLLTSAFMNWYNKKMALVER